MKFRYVAKEKISKIPKTPGVYSFKNSECLLYIGKAANLRDRVKTHFMQPNYRDHFFIDQADTVGYIETESEIEALLLESQLIKQELPKYNVMWKDGKNYFFVGIAIEELPRVFLTHQPKPLFERSAAGAKFGLAVGPEPTTRLWRAMPREGGRSGSSRSREAKYIGPFVDGKAIKRTLRSLRRVFPYYGGSSRFRAQHGPKLCQYCHLGLCPGPTPNKKEYRKNIRHLVATLQGKKPAVLKKLQREMILASKNQEYERAGRIRDQIQDLEIIFSHARVLRPAEERASIAWPTVEKYLQKILQTKKRISRAEAYDISNMQGKEATGSMPVFIDGKSAKEHYRKFKIRIAGKANDFAMLQEVITRRLAHKEWPYPDLMIIDGGKPQLTAALKALERYKISPYGGSPAGRQDTKYPPTGDLPQGDNIHVAAIAKKHNELFLPGKPKPLLLKDMPQNVSNFILHIRDEAHRFAISYHRKLRTRKLLV